MDVIKGHGHANQWLGPSIAVRGQQGQSSSRFFDATLAMRGWPSIGEADSLAVSESPFQKTSTATRVHFYCSSKPLSRRGYVGVNGTEKWSRLAMRNDHAVC